MTQLWPLAPDEHLIIADDSLHNLIGYSEGLRANVSPSPDLFDFLSRADLHDLRNAAGLSQAQTTGLIAGSYDMLCGLHDIHIRRAGGLAYLHIRPPCPPSRENSNPTLALNMLLRQVTDVPQADIPRQLCTNLRAVLGARQVGLMHVSAQGARTLFPAEALTPESLPPHFCQAFLESQHIAPVQNHDPATNRNQRITFINRKLSLPASIYTDRLNPILTVSAPIKNTAALCFFAGGFARKPLSFEFKATLETFARIVSLILSYDSPSE